MASSPSTVQMKVSEYWPEQVDEIMALLDDFAPSCEHQPSRVQLAVLKLAEGSRESLMDYLDLAKQDYRDVLAWAEYPHAMKAHHLIGFNLTPEQQQEHKAISKLDREQYLSWLNGSEDNGQYQDEEAVGLHLYSNYGSSHTCINDIPTEALIVETLDNLDWQKFHQVVIVKSNGQSLGVGGSLNQEGGLSSSFRDQQIVLVTKSPPKTVDDMKFILCSFHRDDGQWKEEFSYV